MCKIIEFPIKPIIDTTEEVLHSKEIEEVEEVEEEEYDSYFGWTAEEYKEFLDEVAAEEWQIGKDGKIEVKK